MSSETTYKCDRCEGIIELGDLSVVLVGYRHELRFELCPKCYHKFLQLMKGKD